nr:hypothetical protein [Tanacetum cinerariifolium]
MDIMNRLSVKSSLQFRVVSKQWKFSIDNLEFIHENLAFRHMDSNLNIFSLTPVASSEGQAVIDGKIFLIGSERFYNDVGISNKIYLIVSFDLVSYQFHVQDMPEHVRVGEFSPPYYISQLGDSVMIYGSFDFGNFHFIYAWALEVEGGFLSSCILLFTIPHPGGHYLKLLRFNKDNQPIMEATIEDRGRQLAIMNLGHQYGDAIEAKDELLKAYEQCRDISMDKRAMIENFLKIKSEIDYEIQSALFRKATKLEKQIRDKLVTQTDKNFNLKSIKNMGSNIKKFKCLVHYNGMSRGSIFHEDLTYTMLHEMVIKKFNLEAKYPLNLSAKVSSIDDNFDITDDHENYMSFKPDIPETPLYNSKPMLSKHYKKETDVKVGQIFDNKDALDLAIRLKALDEGCQFLNERSTPERKLPVLKLAETYRAMMQDWYYKCRKLAENMTYEITDWASNKVRKNDEKRKMGGLRC